MLPSAPTTCQPDIIQATTTPTELSDHTQNSTFQHNFHQKDPTTRSTGDSWRCKRPSACSRASVCPHGVDDTRKSSVARQLPHAQVMATYWIRAIIDISCVCVQTNECSPTHGSYHWIAERALSVALIPITLAPFAAGSLNPTTDAILIAGLILHSHIGFQYVKTCHTRKRRHTFEM